MARVGRSAHLDELGGRPHRGPPVGGASPRRRGGVASTPPCGPVATATSWARPRPAPPRRRCASAGGRCWPSPSTRRDARATPCAACARLAAFWSPSSAWSPGPELVALGAGDLAPGSVPGGRGRPSRGQRDVPLPRPGRLRRRRRRHVLRTGATMSRPVSERLGRAAGVLAVVGPSGGGKSSLVRAGIAADAAASGPPGPGRHAGAAPDGIAHRARIDRRRHRRRRGPVRGGVHAL